MTTSAELMTTEEFGPYVIYERLGLGGMAQVHRAKKQGIEGYERVVALKRMLSHLAEDAAFVDSFVREAKVASLLVHPNIAQIYDFGRINGIYYIAMEQVDGFDIRKLLRYSNQMNEPIPLGVVLSILFEMCDALEFAHTFRDEGGHPLGIVHRDVSPSNLILAQTGHLKVIDFGIAKAQSRQLRTESGRVKGKLGYMSPEAAMGNVLGPVSDVFSAGVVAHELLTARPLFSAKTDFETMLRIREGEIYPPSRRNPTCPPLLDRVVLATLERDAAKRIPTAGAFRAALENVAAVAGVRVSARDVAEWMQRIPREDQLRTSGAFPQGRSSQQSGGHSNPNLTMPSRPTNRAHRPSASQQLPLPPPQDDESDVWADDQPLPLANSGMQADFSAAQSGPQHPPYGTPSRSSIPSIAQHPAHIQQTHQSGQFQPSQPSQSSQSSQISQPLMMYPSGSQQMMPGPIPIVPDQKKSSGTLIAILLLLVVVAGGLAIWAVIVNKPVANSGPVSPPTATLRFEIEPADAIIEVGGRMIAMQSPYESQVEPGMYTITVKHDGYVTFTNAVTLKDGERQSVKVALEKASPSQIATQDATDPKKSSDRDSPTRTPPSSSHTSKVAPVKTEKTEKTEKIGKTGNTGNTGKTEKTEKIETVIVKDEPKDPDPVIEPLKPPDKNPIVVEPPKVPDPPKPTRTPTVPATSVTKLSGDLPAIKMKGANEGQSDVLAKICIDESGRVTDVQIKKANAEIATQLQPALMKWRYRPYLNPQKVVSPVCFPLSLRVVLK